MIRNPSIKTLLTIMDMKSARIIKGMMSTHHPGEVLEVADRLMNTSGVEDLYPEYPSFRYVNTGDTYKHTLCYDGNRYLVCSWGDWAEGNDYRKSNHAKAPFINF